MLAIGLPYIPGWDDLRPFVADLWLVAVAVAVLLTPFFTRRSNTACAVVVLTPLTAMAILLGILPTVFFFAFTQQTVAALMKVFS